MSEAEGNYKELMSRALLALKKTQDKLNALEQAAVEPIAIIGMACRFPGGVDNPEQLWQLLADGRDAMGPVPPERWDVEALYDPDPGAAGKMSTRDGGFLADVDRFDPLFFGMSPKEAVFVDPQQRLMLEVAWEAIENAHLAPDTLHGSRTGVLVGISTMDYNNLINQRLPRDQISRHIGTGTAFSPAAGRIAYLLGLNGPAMAVDTACSSSLVATHLAVESLRRRETDMMIVGGVGLILSPMNSITFSKARMLAADGRCKPFSDAADGYGRGEGVAAVVLKRLSDAERDGDPVLALIRGSAVNQDGASGGLTIPNGPAQQAVVRQALASGRIDPADVSYVEAHGTGTSLGDPIELGALGAVYRATHDHEKPLFVGAVKSNIGHTEAAAGLAGLIKVVLQLRQRQIPPLLHLHTPNTHVDWQALPLAVPTRLQDWPARNGRWLAGVSSFGFSGTNAHVVLEHYAAPDVPAADENRIHVLPLSAQKPEALRALAARYLDWLDGREASLHDLCLGAALGRGHLDERAALVADSIAALRRGLADLVDGRAAEGIFRGDAGAPRRRKAMWSCFGPLHGDHPGDSLYEASLRQCREAADSSGDEQLRSWVRTDPAPLLRFAQLHARAEAWRVWSGPPLSIAANGPDRLLAACVAGVLTLQQALSLLAGHAAGEGVDRARVRLSAIPLGPAALTLAGAASAHDWLAQAFDAATPEHGLPFAEDCIRVELTQEPAQALAEAYAQGLEIRWPLVYEGQAYRKLALPNYPFQRQRYWPPLE